MVKYLLCFFLISTTWAFAADTWSEARLQSVYGKDLTQAPFYLKFAFQKQFNQDWSKSYYTDRKQFLMDYENSVDLDAKKAQAQAKQEAQEEKEQLLEEKQEAKEKNLKLRAEHLKELAEAREEKERQREFYAQIKKQQQEIDQLNSQTKAEAAQQSTTNSH